MISKIWKYLLALLTAILLILVFPRFGLTWLAPIAVTPLLVALAHEPRSGRRFLLGYITGVVYWFGVCYWIEFVLAYYGGLNDFEGWAVFLLFCLAKAMQMGFFGLLGGIALRTRWAIPAISALWVAIEITHGYLGFAWLALGNAGIDMGLPMRLAPYTGVYGVSFVFMMMATALALALLHRPRLQLAWLLLLPLLIFLPPLPRAQRTSQTAVLVQPNVSEDADWTRTSLDQTVEVLSALSMRSVLLDPSKPPTILVWPEIPAPFYYYDDGRFRDAVDNLAHVANTDFLLGVVAHTPQGAPLNSAVLINSKGDLVSRYDKIKLVPFGEFVPWPFDFAKHISSEVGDFAAGTRVVVSPVGEHKIGAFICYESVFPQLVRQFAAKGAEVLFNLSNDGYFGKSAAREQHLEIVRMRAAENRRWLLRATNDGITAAVDPAGRLRRTLPPYVRAAARTGFNFIDTKTFYTLHGDWFAVLCAVLAIASVAAGVSRGESPERHRP